VGAEEEEEERGRRCHPWSTATGRARTSSGDCGSWTGRARGGSSAAAPTTRRRTSGPPFGWGAPPSRCCATRWARPWPRRTPRSTPPSPSGSAWRCVCVAARHGGAAPPCRPVQWAALGRRQRRPAAARRKTRRVWRRTRRRWRRTRRGWLAMEN
jgi:hypothetical protein